MYFFFLSRNKLEMEKVQRKKEVTTNTIISRTFVEEEEEHQRES